MKKRTAGKIALMLGIPTHIFSQFSNSAYHNLIEYHWAYGYVPGFGVNVGAGIMAYSIGTELPKKFRHVFALVPLVNTLNEIYPIYEHIHPYFERFSTSDINDVLLYWAGYATGYFATKGLHKGWNSLSAKLHHKTLDDKVSSG